jgi:hypothetical protein
VAMSLRTEFMWKDKDSNVGDCPSLSRVIKGPDGYVVVGKKVDAETRAQIPQVGDDEIAVFVPANVIDRIRDL